MTKWDHEIQLMYSSFGEVYFWCNTHGFTFFKLKEHIELAK